MKTKRYQIVEREAVDVSLIWKVSHVLIFVLIAVNSLVSAYAFTDIVDYFGTSCPLYGKPIFHLRPFTLLHNSSKPVESKHDEEPIKLQNSSSYEEKHEVNRDPICPGLNISKGEAKALKTPEWLYKQDYPFEMRSMHDWSSAKPVPGATGVFLLDNQLWVFNDTKWTIYIDLSRIRHSTKRECDLVLFVPLFSTTMAFVLAGLTMTCGRGGRGYRSDIIKKSWIYVYPIIVASIVMTLLSFSVYYSIFNGFQQFCKRFEIYTGQTKCNELIDFIYMEHRVRRKYFYRHYIITVCAYALGPIFWLAQLVVACIRVATFADFQFNQIKIKPKRKHDFQDDFIDIEELYSRITSPKIYTIYEEPKK